MALTLEQLAEMVLQARAGETLLITKKQLRAAVELSTNHLFKGGSYATMYEDLCGEDYEDITNDLIHNLNKKLEVKPEVVLIDVLKDFNHYDECKNSWYQCPDCLRINVFKMDKYCSDCGVKFEWTGIDDGINKPN